MPQKQIYELQTFTFYNIIRENTEQFLSPLLFNDKFLFIATFCYNSLPLNPQWYYHSTGIGKGIYGEAVGREDKELTLKSGRSGLFHILAEGR